MADYDLLKNALAIGSAKEAAIYSDFVIPFDMNVAFGAREEKHAICFDKRQDKIAESLMPDLGDAASFYRGYVGLINSYWSLVAIQKWRHEEGSMDGFLDQDKEYLNALDHDLVLTLGMSLNSAVKKMVIDSEYHKAKALIDRKLNNGVRSVAPGDYSEWREQPVLSTTEEASRSESILAILQGLDMVDAERLSWRQILEIRRDKKSLSALRDLRLFLYKESAELEESALVDQIASHYEKYRSAVKWWKLETIKKPLSMMVSKEGIGLTSLGAIGSFLLTGAPIDPVAALGAAKTALASGATLNIAGTGALSLHASHMEREQLNGAAGSEVRYLAYLNRKTGDRP